MKSNNNNADMVTSILKSLLEGDHVSPKNILAGVHNLFVHGEILEELGYFLDEKEEYLEKLFEGFDISIWAMKKLTK